MPVCNLPASSASSPQGTAEEDALLLPQLFPADFTLFPQQMLAFPCGRLSAGMTGRGWCLLPSTQPLSGSKGHLRQRSLSSPSRGNHRAPRPTQPGRLGFPQAGNTEQPGFPCLFLKRRCCCPGVCVSVPWDARTVLGLCGLGLCL